MPFFRREGKSKHGGEEQNSEPGQRSGIRVIELIILAFFLQISTKYLSN